MTADSQPCHCQRRKGWLRKAGATVRPIAPVVAAAFLAGCGDECTKYSDFTCSEIQDAEYNVYFYYPSGSEAYLGRAQGLTQCGDAAHGFAASKNLQGNRDWGYVCCMRAKGSECYEKHR